MGRANRHHLPGYVWHVTHRCHKREFLLKFEKDKKRWAHWLFESKKCFGLVIFNYTITSNHIHLLVFDIKNDVIPKSIQLTRKSLKNDTNIRDSKWNESIAVGDKEFIVKTQENLGAKAIGRNVVQNNGIYELRESQTPDSRVFDPEKCTLRYKNSYFLEFFSENTEG